ncbi:MAG: hypothetical protein GX595_20510 [Lentisphaerae bacterium]|nr:hypothetical protein [Lentisphaerota bacterium]
MTTQIGRAFASVLAMAGLLVVLVPSQGRAQEPADRLIPLEVTADDYQFSTETGLAHGEGNVRVRYQGVALDADVVDVNLKTKDVSARGNVLLRRDDYEWRGDAVSGNVGTKQFAFGTFGVKTGVWHGTGEAGSHATDGTARVDRVRLSTCDLEEPHYSLQARRVLHYPDGKFRAYHVVYRVGSVPVFYWPVVFGDSRPQVGSVSIRPGYSSDLGAFLMIGRTWQVTPEVETTVNLDLFSKRGIALGSETEIRKPFSETDLRFYGLHDSAAPETSDGYNRRFKVQDWRGRANLYHRQELDEALTLRANVDVLSDIDMLEDWYEREYDHDPQPRSFVDVVHDGPRASVLFGARARLNDFYTVVEDLPELRLEMPRQVVSPGLPLLYQGSTSVGYHRFRWRDYDLEREDPDGWLELADPDDYRSLRLDTLHFLYLPVTVAQHVQVVPRAGVRLTHYSSSSAAAVTPADLEAMYAVDNPDDPRNLTPLMATYDDDGGSLTRLAGEVGLEISTKFHRVWSDYRHEGLDLDGLRHIVRPYVNYTFAPDPSEDRENIYFFDEIDRLTEQHFVRVGVDQRLQTRRHQQIYTIARMQTYGDFHFTDSDDARRDSSGFGDLGNLIEVMPTEAFKTWVRLVADLDEMDVRRAEAGLRLGRRDGLRWSLAYIYRDRYTPRSTWSMGSWLNDLTGEHGYLVRDYVATQNVVGEVTFPINEKTSGRMRLEYDIEESELSRQVYEIIRDLHCWMGSLALSEDNGDIRIMVMLYIKAYPGARLDVGL